VEQRSPSIYLLVLSIIPELPAQAQGHEPREICIISTIISSSFKNKFNKIELALGTLNNCEGFDGVINIIYVVKRQAEILI
jgi:hypothetical protein